VPSFFSHRHHLERYFTAVVRSHFDKEEEFVRLYPAWKEWFIFVKGRIEELCVDCDKMLEEIKSKSDKDFGLWLKQKVKNVSPHIKLRAKMLWEIRKNRQLGNNVQFLDFILSEPQVQTEAGCRQIEKCLFWMDYGRFPLQVTRRRFSTHRIS